jgi:hypothetical protein
MLSVFQQLRASGLGLIEAITEGAMQRLRTVLMTTFLAAFGLLPMAISKAIGAETQRPLAIVVIGGLASATLLTLLVLPALYAMWFGRSPDAPPPAETPVPAPVPAPLTADTLAAPPWLTQARFVWPQPVKFQYDVVGESKGLRFNASGELLWQHDNVNYQMKLDISHMLLGSRIQTSVGQLGPQGLQPKRFGEKSKQELAAHFEREKGQVVFSANSTPQALQVAAQDRLSLFAQLAALLAGSPELRQPGQQLSFQIVSSKSAELWSFQVADSELLNLPAGKLTALKVSRLPLQNHDQTADMWLAPAHGYLPVKVRIAQSNGDVFEQQLRKVQAP